MNKSLQTLLAVAGFCGVLAAHAASPAAAAPPAGGVPAVQTQSADVSKTGVAPPPGGAVKTPGRKDPSQTTAAPGGGAGKVWANPNSKTYHCMDDKYYGKTRKGEYMTEADAKAKGMHAAHKKACAA